ncbi:MAG TPA: hypothetical protein PLO23_05810 [Alphaproteobacteria bacterium]|nr:hypothetical protein [Alphaproteobacteria bacterium]
MNRVLALQKHKNKPDDNFAEALRLLAEKAVLVSPEGRAGLTMAQINEIFVKHGHSSGLTEEWMFVQLYKLMARVQAETAVREVSEARSRLLAVMLGLGNNALDTIEILDMSGYPDIPRDANVRFCAMAQDIKFREQKRAKADANPIRTATILEFNPEP